MKTEKQKQIDREIRAAIDKYRKENPHKDAFLLKCSIKEHHDDWYYAHEAVQNRKTFLRCLRDLQEGGKIAVVYGFRDCDMAVSDGNVRILPATKEAVAEWEEDFYADAEGPQWWHFERPSVARGIEHTSRDLALEAFEDGHAHSVSSVRYDEEGSYYV